MKCFFPKSLFPKGLPIAVLAALVFSLGACDITSLNDNPNEPGTVSTPNLLANAQNDMATIYWDDYPGSFWLRYAQYWTTNQYTDGDRYKFPSARGTSNDANWEDSYLVLNDLQEIIRINRDPDRKSDAAGFGPAANQIAIAQVMQAFLYQMMTDMWGPIPYNEALKGRSDDNFTPAYTSQEDIYRGLIDTLTAASEMIDTSTPALASSDLIYGGDMSKWKKLANSLKMRVAIRMSDVAPDVAATAIDEALAAGTFTSNDDDALIPFSGSPPYQNPFYENYEVDGRDDWAATEAILGVMNDTEDPRRASYFTSGPEGQFNGLPYGLKTADAQTLFTDPTKFFSRPGLRVRQADAPMIMMLYDEVLFIKAEAALRSDLNVSNISEDPETLYQDAIRASMGYWDVTDEDAIQNTIDALETPTEGNYEQTLGVQKWLALYMQGMQGWSVFRRYDFDGVFGIPEGNPGQDAFGCDFPVRMKYPNTERAVNAASLQSAVDDYLGGTDDQGVALWWDTETPFCN